MYIYKFVILNVELIILSKQGKKKEYCILKGPAVVSNAMHFRVGDYYLVFRRGLSGTLSII